MSTTRTFLVAPEAWSPEAVEAFASAFFTAAPKDLSPVEENTLPSWLWRKRAKNSHVGPETSVYQVFDRVAGAATYAGWKKDLWHDEAEAKAFYDNVNALLTHRALALEPSSLPELGVDWAYGSKSSLPKKTANASQFDLETQHSSSNGKAVTLARNTTIDAIVSASSPELKTTWQKFLSGSNGVKPLTLKFADTTEEWGGFKASAAPPRIVLDLLKFARDDKTIDLAALQKATRCAVLLLELHYDQLATPNDPSRALSIGAVNLAPLLMALTIPYDSSAGRATAAAISAIITAEAVMTSSELASALGPCPAFSEHRETTLRALRNHRRAAYGEHNDYERISILPVSLDVEAGADLVLMAAARRLWDEALEQVHQSGLRHLQLTEFFTSPVMTAFLECTAQGAEPETHIVLQRSVSSETYRRVLNPAVTMALAAAGCDPADIKGITDYAVGYTTLRAAPGINHVRLMEKGFDAAALERLESYLPNVSHIRQAFTPWILGETFCRQSLKIDAKELLDPRFDLLKHLGYTDHEIAQANAFCCGRGTIIGAAELPSELKNVFATDNLTQDTRILMAAAVQSMIMGDVHLTLSLPVEARLEERENLILAAWMKGLKSVTLTFEGFTQRSGQVARDVAAMHRRKPLRRKMLKPPMPLPSHTRVMPQMTSAPAIKSKTKATARSVSLKQKPATHSAQGLDLKRR